MRPSGTGWPNASSMRTAYATIWTRSDGGLAAFVFVGQIGTVAAAEAIDFAGEAPGFGGEVDLGGVAVVLGVEGGVQLPAGVDALVGDADFLDLFEVEEAGTIRQGMEGHDANGRGMAIENRQGQHEQTPDHKDSRAAQRGALHKAWA
jgi:hypothetical protein